MFPGKRKKDKVDEEEYIEEEDEFFDALEEEFENIASTFEEIRKRILKDSIGTEGSPFVYGFSMRIGPDGKPNIEEFGNIPGILSGEASMPSEREPLTDVIEGEKEIYVIVELPGVEKKDIDLKTTEAFLEINVETPERSYHKKLSFPCKVKPETAKASYKNGVLEVRVERIEQRKGGGVFKVKVD
jgi:HSP20 family protein